MNHLRKVAFILYAWLFILLCTGLAIVFRILGNLSFMPERERKSILFLAMFFPENAGFHYRVSLWSEKLQHHGYKVKVRYIFERSEFEYLSSREDLLSFHFRSYAIRLRHVLESFQFEHVIVRRSLLPYNQYGELFMDRLLLSIHPKSILDFDDDLTNNMEEGIVENVFGRILLENKMIFYDSLRLYRNFFCGSQYLQSLLLKQNLNLKTERTLVLPTCTNYGNSRRKPYPASHDNIVLGWIGTDNNQFYLHEIIQELNSFALKQKIKLLVISGSPFNSLAAKFEIENRKWSLATEVSDMMDIDIGLMPLRDDKRCRAKCGFKLIQYMALGIVPLASAVGVNREIVDEGQSGFLVESGETLSDILDKAVSQWNRFNEISLKAGKKVEEKYSFDHNMPRILQFLNSD